MPLILLPLSVAFALLYASCAAPPTPAARPAPPTATAPAPVPPEARSETPLQQSPRQATEDQSPIKRVRPFEGVEVILHTDEPSRSRVEVAAVSCLDSGWLEQVACGPNTREHESLVVVSSRPSQIHAALLMAGFEPGKPGRWIYENDTFDIIKPTGEKLDIRVRYVDAKGESIEHEIGKWIREAARRDEKPRPFPREPFIFGGSRIEKNAPGANDDALGEHYVADMSGSIIGLVTFGDEMIGFSVVRSDQEAVQEPSWEIDPEAMPPIGTAVALIISKWKD